MSDNYFQSPEFRRVTTNATDSGVKLFFKYVGIVFKVIIDFIKEMVGAVMGK